MINNSLILRKWGMEYIRTAHEIPRWYPHIFSGMPSLGSLLYSPFYPVRFIHDIFRGLLDFFMPIFVLRHLLCGVWAYILLRGFTRTRTGSLIGAIIYTFPPYLIALTAAGHGGKLSTASYLPLLLLATVRLFRSRNLLNIALLALVTGLMLLAQHPQIACYGFLMIGFFVLYKIITSLPGKRLPGGIPVFVLLVALAISLGFCLSAILYMPVMEYTPHSIRGSHDTANQYDYATSWSFHPKEIATFFIPSFFGFGGETYWGAMPFTDYPNYFGIVAMILALTGFIFSRRRSRCFFLFLALFALFVSFGKHFNAVYNLLYFHLPYFSSFRVPVLILVLLILSVSSLAAMGIEFLEEHSSGSRKTQGGHNAHKNSTTFKRFLSVTAVLFGIFAITVILMQRRIGASIGDHFSAMGVSSEITGRIVSVCMKLLVRDTIKMITLAGATLCALYLTSRRIIGFRLLSLLLFVLVIADIFSVNSKLRFKKTTENAIDMHFAETDVVRFLKEDDEYFRILPLASQTSSNWYGYHGISSIGGYNPAKLQIYNDILEKLTLANQNVIDMLNTKYLVSTGAIDHPDFTLVFEGTSGKVYENRRFLPRAFLISKIRVIDDPDLLLDALKSPSFDPSKEALLDQPPPFEVKPGECGAIEITELTPHSVTARAEIKNPCLMVLSEVYFHPGWRCLVNGREQEIYRANYILRSIFLRPGLHSIEFIFSPDSYRKGKTLTFLSAGIIIVLFGFHYGITYRRRRRTPVGQHGGHTDV
jgi:hypothetical protein